MCGCGAPFVHGLALPRNPVKGVEDPSRPEAIWQFAWEAGSQRINRNDLALVVNPARLRSQDQLHVHIVRLGSNARARLTIDKPDHVPTLDEVWHVVGIRAHAEGLSDYGVLVTADSAEGYLIAVTSGSREAIYTEWRCK